jgi:hypothetical protein
MPLIKSTSKEAFGENIAKERAAGKPIKQAVAIAYAEKREAAKGKTDSHSSHSSDRSDHYHKHIALDQVRPTEVMGMKLKATRSEHAPGSMEDMTEKGHKL